LRLALITTNLSGGGAENVLLRIAGLLGERGHEVHLLLLENRIDHAIDPGIRVHALTASGRRHAKGWLGKRIAAWRLHRRFAQLQADGEFDAVVSTLPFADEVAALARLPRLWHRIANTLSAEIGALELVDPLKAARRRARYRSLYGDANLIAVSEGVARDLREELGLSGSNIVQLANPLDFARLRRLASAPVVGLPTVPFVVHAGRFAKQKRHDLLLDAWRRAKRQELLVLLCQPDSGLDALVHRFGLAGRVMIAGFQKNPYPWFKCARLLVLCSDHEGMPNVLVEALACGTPVVSTDCPSGPREILTGSLACCLVPRNDPEQLAKAIAQTIASPPPVASAIDRFEAAVALPGFETLPARWRAPKGN